MSAVDLLQEHGKELSDATGVLVEIVPESGTNRVFVLLSNVGLPLGAFIVDRTNALFMTDQMYPLSAMDMFWTEVGVLRADGSAPQSAESVEQYLGRPWRRFSWHRNGIWNPKGNPLLDHFAFMEARLAKEARP